MVRKAIKILFVFIIVGSLLMFVSLLDIEEVLAQIQEVGFGFIWVIIVSFLSYLSGSAAWYYCFRASWEVSYSRLFFIRTIGENVTLFNPTNIIGGEGSKYLMLESMNLTKEEKWDSILISRGLMIFSQLFLFILCVIWILYRAGNMIPGILIGVLGFVVLGGSCVVISRLLTKVNFGPALKGEWINRMKAKVTMGLRRISKIGFHNKKRVAWAFALSLIHWLFGGFEIFIILILLGVPAHLMDCILVDTGVVIFKSMGGFVPGQIGVEESGNKWMLTLAGIQGASLWISVSIIRRAKQLTWILASAVFYFIILKIQKPKLKSDDNLIYHA